MTEEAYLAEMYKPCENETGEVIYQHCPEELPTHYEVAGLNWEEVQIPFAIGVWVVIASLAKIAFHYTRLAHIIPESCILIIIGFLSGAVLAIAKIDTITGSLDAELFFLYLLPPIMLEAGYFMPTRPFFNNIGTILMYAVFGTLFNAFCVGMSLWGISELGWFGSKIQFLELLTFASLISAVDPVAVLAVFEEIHVNEVLYILVFGESLLNDAVTVVLYRLFNSFDQITEEGQLSGLDVFLGFVSFFVISFGGIAIGLIFGFITAFLSKFTEHIRVIEPVLVFVMSYLAYLTAELFYLSSILSIVSCAMFMKPYVERNISKKSHTTVKYFMKMMSSLSETIIFIFLGISTVTETNKKDFNIVFILVTLLFCSVYRAIGVVLQTWFCNKFRVIKVSAKEQFIMAYGGIRGAIAFSLVALLCKKTFVSAGIMFTTTIIVVMFTVFIQGATIKPLVNKLHVKKDDKHKPSLTEEIFSKISDNLLAGMEQIIGRGGSNVIRQKLHSFNKQYLKKMLIAKSSLRQQHKFVDVYYNLTQKEAEDYITTHGAFLQSKESGNGNTGFESTMHEAEVTRRPKKESTESDREIFRKNVLTPVDGESFAIAYQMMHDKPIHNVLLRNATIHMNHVKRRQTRKMTQLATRPLRSKTTNLSSPSENNVTEDHENNAADGIPLKELNNDEKVANQESTADSKKENENANNNLAFVSDEKEAANAIVKDVFVDIEELV